MNEEINLTPRKVEDFTRPQIAYWKCEKCNTLFQYPYKQKVGMECPFCKISLVKCNNDDPLLLNKMTDDLTASSLQEKSAGEKLYLLIKRDKNGKIKGIDPVDKEKFEQVKTQNHQSTNNETSIELTTSGWTEIDDIFSIHPFSDFSPENLSSGFKIVIYKQGDYCSITRILNDMFVGSFEKLKDLIDNKTISYELLVSKSNKNSLVDKNNSIYPQIAIFYHGVEKDYFIEYLPLKDLNKDSITNMMLYYCGMILNGQGI